MLVFSDLVKFKESIPLLREEQGKRKQELLKIQAQLEVYTEQIKNQLTDTKLDIIPEMIGDN